MKTPKKAAKAIELLDNLADQLHYFYGNSPKFRPEVLVHVLEIEQILRDLAVNQMETHHKIAKRYESYYKNKLINGSVHDNSGNGKLSDAD
jgi:hypothetical protein